ncbi:hypothetical protein DPMN_098023 [Dreissena polymorpha]|uniref:Uncharacterized protein n=1 Tax=Dreissena polymorpha TaxID=45954 RepID=A0A9D4LC82_DREPO|nr:hypothetical protein DPMN_098023 [Dreissena polymorpha]
MKHIKKTHNKNYTNTLRSGRQASCSRPGNVADFCPHLFKTQTQYFALTTSKLTVFPERADSTISSAYAMLMASSSAFVTLSLRVLRVLGGGTVTIGTGCGTSESDDD